MSNCQFHRFFLSHSNSKQSKEMQEIHIFSIEHCTQKQEIRLWFVSCLMCFESLRLWSSMLHSIFQPIELWSKAWYVEHLKVVPGHKLWTNDHVFAKSQLLQANLHQNLFSHVKIGTWSDLLTINCDSNTLLAGQLLSLKHVPTKSLWQLEVSRLLNLWRYCSILSKQQAGVWSNIQAGLKLNLVKFCKPCG